MVRRSRSANLRALGAGTRTADLLAIATDFRARHPDTPLVLMGYANPMVRRGAEWFAEAAPSRGRRGDLRRYAARAGPRARPGAARDGDRPGPAGDADHRRGAAAGRARWRVGFPLLCLGRGDHRHAAGGAGEHRRCGRAAEGGTDLPVAVGFGIRTPTRRRRSRRVADGVVVGSAIVDLIGEHGAAAAGP
jgi:tryptophan synthase alpha chain